MNKHADYSPSDSRTNWQYYLSRLFFFSLNFDHCIRLRFEHLYSPMLAENQETNKQENK